MTPQELFSRTFTAIVLQGEPSAVIDNGRVICRYRGNGDCKCAAGHWIKDEHYHHQCEGRGVRYDIVWKDMILKSYPELDSNPSHDLRAHLEEYQSIHDRCAKAAIKNDRGSFDNDQFLRNYRHEMMQIAKIHGYEMPINV